MKPDRRIMSREYRYVLYAACWPKCYAVRIWQAGKGPR
jgi:hypothetical protein